MSAPASYLRLCASAALALAIGAVPTPAAEAQTAGTGAAQSEPPGPPRAIPGQPVAPIAPPVLGNPNAVPPPAPTVSDTFLPLPDRWRILDALGRKENFFDPYNTNSFKADKPIFGDDWFFSLGAISDLIYQPARVPTPVSFQEASREGQNGPFGRYGQTLVSETALLDLDLFRGDTAYKPPDMELRLTPAFNFNHTDVQEVGVINVDPSRGTTRDDSFLALQQAYVDYHIRNASERFDFDSIRVGIQPFSTDFRGFLFQDTQLGIRLFGNRDNNIWQYNLAYFRRLDKDTNSGLNDIDRLRRDDVFVANVYHEDLPVHGFTSQVTYVRNDNHEGGQQFFDNNGFLVRPLPIGNFEGYNYDVNYLGYNGDGHFGRFNLTVSTYWAFGHQDNNEFSPNAGQKNGAYINAFFFAAEPSIDFDWFRIRGSLLYQSGDNDPQGGRATGFDAIFENPQFAGADSSYWIRQAIPLIGGGGVALSQPNGVLADLRSSKNQGQSNFINPGLELIGAGADFDVTPELVVNTNVNYLRFVTTAPLGFLRHQTDIPNSIGWDLSIAFTYRPIDTQNIVLRLQGATLIPGRGLDVLYQTGNSSPFGGGNFLYTALFNVILTY